MSEIGNLWSEAGKLPVEERLRLAQDLIRSVESSSDEAVEEAWATELERRARDVAEGSVETVDAEAVHRRILERLMQVRARRGAG